MDGALKKWQEAHEVDPTDAVHLSNIAAIQLEAKENDKAIEICEQAIKLFDVHATEIQLKARVQQRLGTAQLNKKEFGKALELLGKSLLEKKTDQVNELKLKAEEELEAQAENLQVDKVVISKEFSNKLVVENLQTDKQKSDVVPEKEKYKENNKRSEKMKSKKLE